MILQKDGRIELTRPQIRENGCYYMCLLRDINMYTNMSMSAETIADGFYKLFLKRGWIRENTYVENAEAILNWGGVKCIYTDKHETPDRMCARNEFEFLYWRHPEVGGHFTCGNGRGIVTYDPWGVSKAATEGALLSKRIFRIT